jgi:hypothetical protein
MKNALLTVFLFVILCGSSASQDFSMPELQGYKKNTDYPVFTAETLGDFKNADSEKYLSFGFVDLQVAEYKKGKNVIRLEIYRHTDNIMAFGIYSSERSPAFRFLNLGVQGYSENGAINFFKGNYYVKLKTYSKNEKTLQAEESLAQRVSNMLPGDSKLPDLLTRFPETGKLQNAESFINENVLGHKFLKKAFKAVYLIGSDNFSIYVFEKKSSDEARQIVAELLKSVGMDISENDSGKYVFTDGYNGTVFLAFKENDVVIISGLAKDQTAVADQYTSEILKY